MQYRSLTAAALLLLCAGASAAESGPADTIYATEPFARAVPPGQPNSAVFMQLSNAGDEDRALVAAASPAAEVVELHTHRMEDGMMKMRRIERIALPARETVTLQPGGLHVMLIGLTEQLQPGGEIAVTLTFDDDSTLDLTIPVREIAPMAPTSGGAHGEPRHGPAAGGD